jgi:hypothetical protein
MDRPALRLGGHQVGEKGHELRAGVPGGGLAERRTNLCSIRTSRQQQVLVRRREFIK